jgi:hypothetical protein
MTKDTSNYTSHLISGTNQTGRRMDVAIYGTSYEHAEQQYNFRYGGIGYRATGTAEEPQAPAKRFRKRGSRKGPFRKRQRRQQPAT